MARSLGLEELPGRATATVGVDALTRCYVAGFSRGGGASVGLEEELILVDPESLRPVNEVERVLAELGDRRFEAEFRAAQLELIMPVSLTVSRLCEELARAREEAVEVLRGRVSLLAAGTHPTAWGPITVTDRPRYRGIAADHAWATRRGLPSGLHVHVGVGDPDEALAVYNAARTRLPELAALAANSPFFEGGDSGLASSRLKLVEDLPRSGIPPAFESWRELAAYVDWGLRAGLFADPGHLWWDLRPRPDLGTIEFRVADAQTSVAQTAAVVAVIQALVASLSTRFRAGDRLTAHPAHVIAENRWRAIRDGVVGELVDPDTGEAEPTRNRIGRLLLELEPYAADLGSSDELEFAWAMLARNGAVRQREVAAELGLTGLERWLVRRTESSLFRAAA
jgi:glutamate---cysteine ligase / carboxylate-amine ligase